MDESTASPEEYRNARTVSFAGPGLAAVFERAADWARAHDDGVLTVIATGVDYDPEVPEEEVSLTLTYETAG